MREQTLEEYVAAQRTAAQQRAAALQEIARSLGASDAMTPEELQREQEKRARDRGGGQSL